MMKDTKDTVVKPVSKNTTSKMYDILIEPTEVDEGDVFIGDNGRDWLIQRGVVARVPEGVIEILRNAITSKMVVDENGRRVYKDMPRFAWRIVSEPEKSDD